MNRRRERRPAPRPGGDGDSPILDVRNVCSGYAGLPVLFDVNLAIHRGELVTMLGGNGAGKSTLLKTILGAVSTSSGELIYVGRRITSLPVYRRVCTGISYSPEGRRVFPNLTTRDNLVAGSHGLPKSGVRDQLHVVYDLFPLLAERSGQLAGSLSGGEQQMLALGRALMQRPTLLMVEELSLGLAPVVTERLYLALRAWCQDGFAVLVAEQFQRFEREHSDRWIVLERGTVVASGTKADAHLLSSGPS